TRCLSRRRGGYQPPGPHRRNCPAFRHRSPPPAAWGHAALRTGPNATAQQKDATEMLRVRRLTHPRGLLILLVLFRLLAGGHGGLLGLGGGLVGGVVGGHGPLGELDADLVGADLDDNILILHLDDIADHAADGGDIVAHLQAAAHIVHGLLLLVLGTNQEEIEHSDHNEKHYDHGHTIWCHGTSSVIKVWLLYKNQRANAREIAKFSDPAAPT